MRQPVKKSKPSNKKLKHHVANRVDNSVFSGNSVLITSNPEERIYLLSLSFKINQQETNIDLTFCRPSALTPTNAYDNTVTGLVSESYQHIHSPYYY